MTAVVVSTRPARVVSVRQSSVGELTRREVEYCEGLGVFDRFGKTVYTQIQCVRTNLGQGGVLRSEGVLQSSTRLVVSPLYALRVPLPLPLSLTLPDSHDFYYLPPPLRPPGHNSRLLPPTPANGKDD